MSATSRKRIVTKLCHIIAGASLLFAGLNLQGQSQPEISTSVDTTSIRIGEQIRFRVRVETDSSSVVFFPEGQTFSPLETVEAFKTDTTRKADRILLEKTYALTQFDSGAYLLPTQRIEVDGKGYFTDSLLISVATVPVDTVKQKMYDIKPLIGVDRDPLSWLRTLGWILLGLLLAGIAVYWYFIRKKPLSAEEEEALLPPFERAMLELKRLETSRYLIQDEFKQYYTELTDIVRSYLEEEVHVSALESTTSELILKLELLKDAGQLRLEPDTLNQFRKILETADLVKFAKSKPEVSQAEQDRLVVESIVVKTKEAIPEPTEEELMQQAEYLEALKIQKKRKKIRLAFASLAGLLFIALISSIAYFGFASVKDTLLGNPSKSLLEGEWVASSYGYPPVILETPEVLYRKDVNLPPEAREAVKEIDAFIYNNPDAKLSIAASSTLFNKNDAEPDFEGSIEQILKGFEEKGARNIITKQETFTTVSGVKGIKIYGRGDFPVPESSRRVDGAYTILMFGGNGFLQELVISWEEGDAYAEEIVDRILKTIEVKTTV
ncbi:hypothetical protein [Robiginitalea sp. IMCC43444]|uniref:hypothetical protein n=1 Tax=Robiginitalea sp. IMCC43444 TaxID=3459121 RepID=UPI004043692D